MKSFGNYDMKFTETKRTLSVLIFLLVYFGLILYFLPVQYAVNDDYAILTEIKNNVNTSFMSPILGYFLSFLYYLNACIPWYGLFLYFIHFVALYILITTVLKRNWNKMLSYGFLFIYLVFYLDFLQKVSYNNSSIMLGITVVVYFLFNIRNLSNARSFLVGLLFAISYLIRGEAIFFVLFRKRSAYFIRRLHCHGMKTGELFRSFICERISSESRYFRQRCLWYLPSGACLNHWRGRDSSIVCGTLGSKRS